MSFPKSVLFIDDDAEDRDLFCQLLHEMNNTIECNCAQDGIEAIEKLNSEVTYMPDYIFIDLNMPKMGGIECLSLIREMTRLDSSKVYLYSTVLNPRVEEQALQLGASAVLVKPSTLSELKDFLLLHIV